MNAGEVSPEHSRKLVSALTVARRVSDELQLKSMVLGYNVIGEAGIKLDPGADPYIDFRVWRVDQHQQTGSGQTFSSVDEVETYLTYLASLPVYCLDLVGNVAMKIVSENHTPFTVVTDPVTGHEFYLRTVDLETIHQLRVHSDEPPPVGNWYRLPE
ncbi:hypothetical protein [Mycolicibacterium goodii]|uniref:Uncharacterized protein n=1 Tax=Mycolicibacterium goodii TaxID=134601 RepID=A0A0K0XES3_MYCGD|nr:hypothetical protein AFA91_32880 [Mycolicibacterium goodii]